MLKPLTEGDSVIAACVFKPNTQELPVCITIRAFDAVKKTFEKSEPEESLKTQQ